MSSVSLNTIVDVTVEISNPTTIATNFNLGLIIGASTVLTAENRVKVYSQSSWTTAMVADGFTATSPEYLAAQAYFSQNPVSGQLAIGVQLAEETNLIAFNACRKFNEEWYGFCFAVATEDTDILAIAQAVEAASIPSQFYYATKDEKCIQSGTTNIMGTLMGSKVSRTIGVYTTQDYLVAGLLGMVSGMNSMEANSAYTTAYKSIVGFQPEEVGDAGITALGTYNGNTYAEFGRRYQFFYPGLCANGYHIDELYFLDVAKYLIQQYTVAGLVSRRVVPQTESGVTDIISFVSEGCDILVTIGLIATGIWKGQDLLELKTGMAVPGGYLIQAGTLADQSAVDRQARKSPPIYVALKGAGAIEHVVIRVFVNR